MYSVIVIHSIMAIYFTMVMPSAMVMHSIMVIYFTMGMHSTMVMLSIMVIYFTTDRKAWQQNDAHKWAGQETGSEFRPKPDSSYNLKGLAS